uniref:(California timema) hypothetical protein n=1 Tax=Timema californicum TaxID=61474 RepID=A0A7R9P6Y4_TIMCA|nr:unnamed protein product [Timema californicum]
MHRVKRRRSTTNVPEMANRRSRRKHPTKKSGSRGQNKGHRLDLDITDRMNEDVAGEMVRGSGGRGEEPRPGRPVAWRDDEGYPKTTVPMEVTLGTGGGQPACNFPNTPLEAAILFQRLSKPFYRLCHGLLAGVALTACVMSYSLGSTKEDAVGFVQVYSRFARIMQSLFSFLATICVLSVFDRLDVYHLDLAHIGDLLRYQTAQTLVLLTYLITLVVTLVTTKWDDAIAIYQYDRSHLEDVNVLEDNLRTWRNLNLYRCLFTMLGWLLVVALSKHDMFYTHLVNMIKYQTTRQRENVRY